MDHRSFGSCAALLLLLGGSALLGASAGWAHSRGLYATQAEAQKRAEELHCKGTFQMGTLWMPCANERALHKALQRAQ